MGWTLIRNCLGDWEIEDTFTTKKEALQHAAFYESDGNPKCVKYGFYEYKSWGIIKTVNLKKFGYDKNSC